MNVAMILAGGTGSRVGADRPKQFIEINSKPILAYTVDIFQINRSIDVIEIVCHCDWIQYCEEMIKKYNLTKVRWIIEGGSTFQESVMNGMHYLESLLNSDISLNDYIFIQYGAAPFTSQKIINSVIEMTIERGSAVTATPCYQLMGTKDTDTISKKWVNRDEYVQIACPYGFRFEYLLDIYKRAKENALIDKIEPHTTSLMYALGDVINLAYGDQTNIKITTKEDILLFMGWIMEKKKNKLYEKSRL